MHSTTRIPKGRLQLAQVIGSTGDVVSIADVQKALQLDRTEAAKRLSRWTGQGWLHRVGSGTYAPVGIDTLGTQQVLDDPWVLVPALFAPGYIGGRTAAEHWDLTEPNLHGHRRRYDPGHPADAAITPRGLLSRCATWLTKKLFGTKTIWRKRSRVQVSDVHRTIVDMLDEPANGGWHSARRRLFRRLSPATLIATTSGWSIMLPGSATARFSSGLVFWPNGRAIGAASIRPAANALRLVPPSWDPASQTGISLQDGSCTFLRAGLEPN